MPPTVRDDDEAKRVVDGAGNSVGLVDEITDDEMRLRDDDAT